MCLVLPRLYVILDSALLKTPPKQAAEEFAATGVRLMQYRDKMSPARELLRISQEIAERLAQHGSLLIVNDRPDVAALAGADGVHVGQDDLEPEQARGIVGTEKVVGVSTHNVEQFRRAAETSADYIAVGPIFETQSKANPDPRPSRKLAANIGATCHTPPTDHRCCPWSGPVGKKMKPPPGAGARGASAAVAASADGSCDVDAWSEEPSVDAFATPVAISDAAPMKTLKFMQLLSDSWRIPSPCASKRKTR